MARHKYRKTNNNNYRENNNFEEDVEHNEDHNHHNNSINNADQTDKTNNKTTNYDNTTTTESQVRNTVNSINNYSATTNDSERYDTHRSEESNITQEKMESLPMIANNDHIVSYDNLQEKEHSNVNNACVDSSDIINIVDDADAKNCCKTPMQSTQTKQAINTASINTTTNDATDTTENDVVSNPQQTSEQVECTLQKSQYRESESCEKESLTLALDGNVVQKDDIDKSNFENNLKDININEVILRGDDTKPVNEPSTITNYSSKVNLMNKDPSTLESTQKESSKEPQKTIKTITSSSSQEVDSECRTNIRTSTNTINDNSASTSAPSADLANDTNTVNIQLESSCECNDAENNQNASSNNMYDNKDARNDVESDNNKHSTTQNNFAGICKIDDQNESNGKKRCTFVDVKAAMAMKPRKSALRVNSPSFSQNCIVDDNSRNENNDNSASNSNNNQSNISCCNISKSNDQSISSSSSAFSSSQVQSNGVGNSNMSNISSGNIHNNNNKHSNNSKDDSARSRRRIRFCDPVVTFQDDGTYSHYYSSNSNVKQRSSKSEELQENQSDAKNEGNSDINNNEHSIGDSYDGKKAMKSSDNISDNSNYNIAAKHGKLVKEIKESSNLTAKSCAISNHPKEVCEQEQQIHNSHEKDRIRTANGSKEVNGVRTTHKKSTKRASKSHIIGDSISKTENSEINETNNLNMSTDAGSYNGKRSSTSNVKHFVTLPHSRLSAATFAMLRERTIAHVQKMWSQLRLRVIVCVLCVAAVIMRPTLRRWLNIIVKRIVNIITHKSPRAI